MNTHEIETASDMDLLVLEFERWTLIDHPPRLIKLRNTSYPDHTGHAGDRRPGELRSGTEINCEDGDDFVQTK